MIILWQSIPPFLTRGEGLAEQKAAAPLDTAAEVRPHQGMKDRQSVYTFTELLVGN